ncbi:uncharacterized protein LOC121402179 isoform X3 [Xenopus laevis]|uniref:Uncharacterized protein LOC121402179 isoform X3 n=1 Tax=Xenopus laevis TaxID=8355 RepID=A0A8J1MRF4_XENLA|nr:uncharacterized protein LOC121402179 isoform X3 [Xenopus laevis]
MACVFPCTCSSLYETVLMTVLLLLQIQGHGTDSHVCNAPKKVKHANDIKGEFHLDSVVRYSCLDGYKREAGTSNLAICMLINGIAQWNYGSTTCVRDPSLRPPPPTSSNSPTTFFPSDSNTSTNHVGTYEEFDFTVASTTEQTQEIAEPKKDTTSGTLKHNDPTTENVLSEPHASTSPRSFAMSTENDVNTRAQDTSQPSEVSSSGTTIAHVTLESSPNGQITSISEPEALTFPWSIGTSAEIDTTKGMLPATDPEQHVSKPPEFTTGQSLNNLGIKQKLSPGYISIGSVACISIIAISLILFLKYRHRAIYKPNLMQSEHSLTFDVVSKEDHEEELECLDNRDSISLSPNADGKTEEVTYL